MARVTPQQGAEKWSRRLSGSTQDIQAGVQKVTESPGVAAARQEQLYLQRVTEAVQSGKWAQALNSVTTQQWQQAMLTKGVPRIAAGAAAAQGKMQQFLQDFLPYEDQGAAQVRQMPKGGVENGIARAAAMIRHNAGYRRR